MAILAGGANIWMAVCSLSSLVHRPKQITIVVSCNTLLTHQRVNSNCSLIVPLADYTCLDARLRDLWGSVGTPRAAIITVATAAIINARHLWRKGKTDECSWVGHRRRTCSVISVVKVQFLICSGKWLYQSRAFNKNTFIRQFATKLLLL